MEREVPRAAGAADRAVPETIGDFAELLAMLEADRVPHRADAATQLVEIPTRLASEDATLLIVWDRDEHLVQLIQPLPFEVPTGAVPAVEDALVRINHALKMPGFGLNLASRYAYFRLAVPRRIDGTLAPGELRRLCGVTVSTAREYEGALRGVALDGERAADVLAAAAAHAPRGAGEPS